MAVAVVVTTLTSRMASSSVTMHAAMTTLACRRDMAGGAGEEETWAVAVAMLKH
jgi:hypothetical protein